MAMTTGASATSDVGFFKLGVILEDGEKTITFLQHYGLIPNDSSKDCLFCGKENCAALHKNAKRNIPVILWCSKCRNGVSAATNAWFEKGRITMKQSLGLIYSWLHNMTGQNAAGEMEVNKYTVYDYYGFCREVCYVIVTNSENVIGGEGKIVEIDESHIYTRKYHRGRFLKNELRKTAITVSLE